MLHTIYKCSLCKGIGYTERWAEKRFKNSFIHKLNSIFRTTTCDTCLGTGINFNRMSTAIFSKSMW